MKGFARYLPEKRGGIYICLILLLCLLGSQYTHGQSTGRFLVYGVKEGLSQNAVHAITRDKDELVWIGTQDGLNSFDGSKFTTYQHNSEDSTSISDQFVLKIKEDARGNLWVGTRNGLNYFDRRSQKFQRFYIDKNERHLFQSNYDRFFVQLDNSVVIEKNGLHLLNAATGQITLLQPYTADQLDWLVLPDYRAWSFSKSHGIFFYDDVRKPGRRKVSDSKTLFAGATDYFHSMQVNDSIYALHNLYATPHLYMFNIKTANIEKVVKLPANVLDVNCTGNRLQLCTSAGFYEVLMDRSTVWKAKGRDPDSGLPPGAVLCSYIDKGGNTWLGTAGSGVAVHNPGFESFTSILTPVANDRITGIVVLGADMFMGTHTGLYALRNFAKGQRKPFEKVLGGKNIVAIARDKRGFIWLALYNGRIEVVNDKGAQVKMFRLPPRLYKSAVLGLYEDSFGRMLICTSYGVFVATAASQNRELKIDTSINSNLQSHYYMSAYEDHQHNVWFAGNMGVDVLDSNFQKVMQFNSNTDSESFLQRSIITSITQDKENSFWISTIRNGIYKYKNGKYTHYTHAAGLSSDICYNVVCDDQNRIWVSTSAGINIFSKGENAFKSISVFEGVPKTSFSFGSVLKHGQYLLFGGTGHLLVCNASNYEIKKDPLRAYISDVKINGESIPIEDNAFSVMPDNKLIRFELAFLPAFYSGNIIYQYRLKGADTNWISLSPGVNSISYTGLPYKKLFMEVRVAGSLNNLKNATVFSLQINSQAPFYKTGLFTIVLVLLAAGLVTLITIYYNKRKYKKQLDALMVEKKLQKERARIGRDLHDNIGAYTSALIAGLNRVGNSKETDMAQISDLKDYGANIMGLLRETIWMLNAAQLTVTAFTDRFINYAMRINKNYPEIDFTFKEDIELDKQLEPTTMLNLFRILQEALQNACKHAGAANIQCSVNSGEQLLFVITDDGSGFNGQGKEGHYGIDNMKERALEVGFSCMIESGAAGTTVTIAENTANA